MMNGAIKFSACCVCGEKFTEVDYSIHKFMYLNEGEEKFVLNKLREQYIRTNPEYDPEMERIREAIERGEPVPPRLIECPVCGGKTSSAAENCPHCGQAIACMMKDAKNKKSAVPQATGPRCPSCNSNFIEKIGAFDRATSIAFWGLASSKIGKQYKCRQCGHKW